MQLPPSTPLFDILLHKRTPLDQQINHLVVQCGENHVHALSQILLTAFTGNCSPIYIPRFAFADMTTEQATKLFETHDQFIKALKSAPLFPLLSNLDTIRTEKFPNGEILKRSTRDWALSIKTEGDNPVFAHGDVVNGGLDQKAYLLFPGKHEALALKALAAYKRRIRPFQEREARFRETIGPPLTINVNPKLTANLTFMETISASDFWKRAPSEVREEGSSPAPSEDTSLNSTDSMPSKPATPAEPVSKPPPVQGKTSADSSIACSAKSGMSDSTAKFRALEKIFKSYRQESEKRDCNAADRLQQMERQFSRIEEVDKKLDTF